jgi:hypothetical protein
MYFMKSWDLELILYSSMIVFPQFEKFSLLVLTLYDLFSVC